MIASMMEFPGAFLIGNDDADHRFRKPPQLAPPGRPEPYLGEIGPAAGRCRIGRDAAAIRQEIGFKFVHGLDPLYPTRPPGRCRNSRIAAGCVMAASFSGR